MWKRVAAARLLQPWNGRHTCDAMIDLGLHEAGALMDAAASAVQQLRAVGPDQILVQDRGRNQAAALPSAIGFVAG